MKPFPILKMKTQFEKEPHPILKMKAHSETHFENKNMYNCVFQKKEKNTHETFHILKMKTHFEKEPRDVSL